MQCAHAVLNHGRPSLTSKQPTRIDFGDVCDKNPLDTSRLRQQIRYATKQLVVRKRFQFVYLVHVFLITWTFSSLAVRSYQAPRRIWSSKSRQRRQRGLRFFTSHTDTLQIARTLFCKTLRQSCQAQSAILFRNTTSTLPGKSCTTPPLPVRRASSFTDRRSPVAVLTSGFHE